MYPVLSSYYIIKRSSLHKIPVNVISSILIAPVVLEIYFDCDVDVELIAKEDFWNSNASPFWLVVFFKVVRVGIGTILVVVTFVTFESYFGFEDRSGSSVVAFNTTTVITAQETTRIISPRLKVIFTLASHVKAIFDSIRYLSCCYHDKTDFDEL